MSGRNLNTPFIHYPDYAMWILNICLQSAHKGGLIIFTIWLDQMFFKLEIKLGLQNNIRTTALLVWDDGSENSVRTW